MLPPVASDGSSVFVTRDISIEAANVQAANNNPPEKPRYSI
jgi:hypothetical protein